MAFTDSLALAFGAPPLEPLTYYLLRDVDAVYRLLGLESTLKFGTTGTDFPTAARALATTLKERPNLSLDSVLTKVYPNPIVYASGAVLTAVVRDWRKRTLRYGAPTTKGRARTANLR
ncbi:hypothetical protein [Gemmatimonas sp.]|uniref:hypothetical protein n=1 Tax=Gemmatimonas sp. TaxID=1962908 RepID=UPI00356A2470